jgi:organic radical activating enzyme
MEKNPSHFDSIRQLMPIMDEVSPSFCMAKWHHVTMYLHRGQTHSCYHPAPHNIPLSEISRSPSALHNTKEKTHQRIQMMRGEKPEGCNYCWNIEALGLDYISDRHDRNASIYTPERLAEIVADPLKPINPQYIEVSFGNECNFKCGYCHPMHSSSYTKEIKDHGPYTQVKNHRNDIDWYTTYDNEDSNPYVKAWWDWWPEMSKSLTILRITGGEPLLQQSTWRLLDDLDKNPLPDLELNINSNLGIKAVLVERLCEKINSLIHNNKIKSFKLYTSIDSWGKRAEYLRTGMDLELWETNLLHYLKNTTMPVTFMVTFNVLSVTSFGLLLRKILEWRTLPESVDDKKWQRIRFDTPYLKEPIQYDINILPKDKFMPYMNNHLEFIMTHMQEGDPKSFSRLELERFRRLVKYMETTNYNPERVLEGQRDFHNWFTEYDRRRGTSLEKTFPEMREFFQYCKTKGSFND